MPIFAGAAVSIIGVSREEHSAEGRYQRPRPLKKVARTPPQESWASDVHDSASLATAGGSTRLFLDEHNHLLKIELLDPRTGVVLESISGEELERDDYHGILVDLAT